MAKIHKENNSQYLELSRKEASDLCALLIAQIADVNCPGNMTGACPEVIIYENGNPIYRLSFVINDEEDSKKKVVLNKVRDLINSGYDGPFSGEAVEGLFKAFQKIK